MGTGRSILIDSIRSSVFETIQGTTMTLPIQTSPRTIAWIGDVDGFVRLLDQTLLPVEVQYRDCRTVEDVWEAIRSLRVRGAPAIGVAAAMGVVVGMQKISQKGRVAF